MPIATRTFRVFVSSTFEDLKEERSALQRDVFPKLRTLCERHGERFQAIDLRWGVRVEAALDQRTMDICLREIERCQATGIKPNFIVLLGDRYGWQPLPSRIPQSEFDPRPIAGDWYRLDENAVPPEYVLQPRTGRFTDPDVWRALEDELRPKLNQAARAEAVTSEALRKYTDSATHQEILAGLGRSEEERRHVFGFFRERSGETDPRLEKVKALVPNHAVFPRGDLKKLCDDVYLLLSEVIEQQAKQFVAGETADPHDAFAAERSRVFKGRREELVSIAGYLSGDERRPLVVHGPSGSGKSALMAKASIDYRSAGRIMRRFIGASPASSDGHSLLTGLCRELAPGEEVPVGFVQLEREFQKRLEEAAAVGPVVLFIDALDQLRGDDPGCRLSWLPGTLPLNVRVVVSTTLEGGKLPPGIALPIGQLAVEDAADAMDAWLSDAGQGRRERTLRDWQRARVLDGYSHCGLPLYLRLAVNEAGLWTSYAAPEECPLGLGVEEVLGTFFRRLSGEANHGSVFVSRTFGYLAEARYGLTEDELVDVLSRDEETWLDFQSRARHRPPSRRLPVIVWSRLLLDVEPYLKELAVQGGIVITFFHRVVRDFVRNRVSTEQANDIVDLHERLASYFEGQSLTPRKINELPWLYEYSADWHKLEEFLSDLDTAEAMLNMSLYQTIAFWQLVEQNTAGTAAKAYSRVLEYPEKYGWHVFRVAKILEGLNHTKESNGLIERYIEKLRQKSEPVMKRLEEMGLRALQMEMARDVVERMFQRVQEVEQLSAGPPETKAAVTSRAAADFVQREPKPFEPVTDLYIALTHLGASLQRSGRLRDALGTVDERRRICQLLEDHGGMRQTLKDAATLYSNIGYRGAAAAVLDTERQYSVLDQKAKGSSADRQVKSNLDAEANRAYDAGDLDRSLELYRQSEAEARLENAVGRLVDVLKAQATILARNGTHAQAQELLLEAEQICRNRGYLRGLPGILVDLSGASRDLGNLSQSLERAREAERLSREANDAGSLEYSLIQQAFTLQRSRRTDEACACLREYIRLTRDRSAYDDAVKGLRILAAYCERRGDQHNAMEALKEAEGLVREQREFGTLAVILLLEGRCALASGDPDRALLLTREAETLARDLEKWDSLRHILISLAVIFEQQGDLAQALAASEEAELICRKLGLHDELAATLQHQAAISERIRHSQPWWKRALKRK